MANGGPILYGQPVNWQYPLGRGLGAAWLGLPGVAGGGTLFDVAGRSPATLTGGPAWRPGPNGLWGLSFSGANYATSGYRPTASAPLTVSAWAWSATGSEQVVWWCGHETSTWTAQYLSYTPGGAVKANTAVANSFAAASGGTAPSGAWCHLAAVWAGGADRRVFLNGVRVGSDTTSLSPDAGTFTATRLGGHGVLSGGSFLVGGLADVIAWPRALPDADVWVVYDQGRRQYPDLLRRVWPVSRGFVAASPPPPASSFPAAVVGGGYGW